MLNQYDKTHSRDRVKDRQLNKEKFKNIQGVTLIELMIVILIVAVLGMVAYPSYQNSMIKTRRSDGISALLSSAQTLERCFTEYNKYNHANCSIQNSTNFSSSEGYYSITVTTTASTFSLSAAAQGAQAPDSSCTPIVLTHTGAKTPTDCW